MAKDRNGALHVSLDGTKRTYRATAADVTAIAATATDIFTLENPAASGKILLLKRVQITGDATAAGVQDFYVFKRPNLNSGGTQAVAPTIVKFDSLDIDASGIVRLYTANPTLGSGGGLVAADHYALPAAATTGYPGMPWIEDFGVGRGKPVVLRAGELCAISLNGNAVSLGLNMYMSFEWEEISAEDYK